MDSRIIAKRVDAHLRVHPEDAGYVALLLRNEEFSPHEKKYGAWLNYNLGGLDTGERLVRRLERHLGPISGMRVLDVGAGSGGMAIAFAKHGCKVTAMEFDPVRVRWLNTRIRDHGVDVRVMESTLEDMRQDEAFDLAICSSVIEHVENWRVFTRLLLQRCARAAYISWPNKWSLLEILSDQHYGLPGTSFLTGPLRFLQRPYIRLLGMRREAWVIGVPTLRLFLRFLKGLPGGWSLARVLPDGIEKLADPTQINHGLARRLLLAAKRLGIPDHRLVQLVLSQKATFECLVIRGTAAAATSASGGTHHRPP